MLYIPTRQDIESLKVGDMAMDCFGRMRPIISIRFQGNSADGQAYIGFSVEFGPHSTVSNVYREDELVRHVGTSAKFNSHQLDLIESDMLANGERVREL